MSIRLNFRLDVIHHKRKVTVSFVFLIPYRNFAR